VMAFFSGYWVEAICPLNEMDFVTLRVFHYAVPFAYFALVPCELRSFQEHMPCSSSEEVYVLTEKSKCQLFGSFQVAFNYRWSLDKTLAQ
jgi:hypothetical protein